MDKRKILKALMIGVRDSILFLIALIGLFLIFAGVFSAGLGFAFYWPIIVFGLVLFFAAWAISNN